jgi:lysozyme family protein
MVAFSYDSALKGVLEHEGGYSNHPADPGGPTNWGITIYDARMYWKANATAADVRAMPLSVAKSIYKTKYWDALRCDALPAGLDYAVFDFGVNSGISRSAKFLQGLVGVRQDGRIGPITITAANEGDAASLISSLCDARLEFLQRLNTWGTFGRGWSRRVSGVRARALEMARQASGKPVWEFKPPPPSPTNPPHTPSEPNGATQTPFWPWRNDYD